MWTLTNMRFKALAALCLVVASVTASAQAKQNVLNVKVTPTMNSAKFYIASNKPATVIVSYGTDKANQFPRPDRAKKMHNITLSPLEPGTTYYYCVRAIPAGGKPSTKCDSFNTGEVAPVTLTGRGGKILLGNVPFFPRMAVEYNCPTKNEKVDVAKQNYELGFNVLDARSVGTCLGDNVATNVATLDGILQHRLWLVNRDPDDLPKLQGLPELMNWQGGGNIEIIANPVSLDSCDRNSSAELYDTIQKKSRLKSIIFWYSVVQYDRPNVPSCTTPLRARNIFWTVVEACGKGTKVFTQLPWAMSDGVSITGAMKTELQKEKLQVAALLPVISSSCPAPLQASPDSIKGGIWRYGGATYIIASNSLDSSTAASFRVAGLKDSQARLMWESGRFVKVKKQTITDTFGPHGVHIYQVPPAPKLNARVKK